MTRSENVGMLSKCHNQDHNHIVAYQKDWRRSFIEQTIIYKLYVQKIRNKASQTHLQCDYRSLKE